MKQLIELQDVHKIYNTGAVAFEALKGVSLEIAPGDYVAVMGHSGSGKSTLLNLVGGIDGPTTGTVTVLGRRLDQMGETELAKFRRAHVGFVFQFFYLLDNLTVRANVMLPGQLLRRTKVQPVRHRADRLLSQLSIAAHADKYPWELSGGQQQRVAIARALINAPDLLLVDEPTGNLDSGASKGVLQILQDCNAGGQTILMVTHDPRAAAEARQVLFIHDGRLVDGLESGDAPQIARRLAELL